MESVASLACRSALAKRGVAHLSIANDVQEETLDKASCSKRNQPSHTPDRWFKGSGLPDEERMEKAADCLNRAEKVVILAGRSALVARHELEEAADLLAAPVAKALLGKKPEQARGVQIDCDAQRIGLRYPVVAGLVGDAAAPLRSLSSLLTRRRPQLSGPRANRNADMA